MNAEVVSLVKNGHLGKSISSTNLNVPTLDNVRSMTLLAKGSTLEVNTLGCISQNHHTAFATLPLNCALRSLLALHLFHYSIHRDPNAVVPIFSFWENTPNCPLVYILTCFLLHRADSVTCALCSRAYHFACLNPPLTRKPERGYTWACAPCSKQRQDKIEDNLFKGLEAPAASGSGSGCGSSYGSSGRTLRDKGKKKEGLYTLIHLLKLGKPPPLFLQPSWPVFFLLNTE